MFCVPPQDESSCIQGALLRTLGFMRVFMNSSRHRQQPGLDRILSLNAQYIRTR